MGECFKRAEASDAGEGGDGSFTGGGDAQVVRLVKLAGDGFEGVPWVWGGLLEGHGGDVGFCGVGGGCEGGVTGEEFPGNDGVVENEVGGAVDGGLDNGSA